MDTRRWFLVVVVPDIVWSGHGSKGMSRDNDSGMTKEGNTRLIFYYYFGMSGNLYSGLTIYVVDDRTFYVTKKGESEKVDVRSNLFPFYPTLSLGVGEQILSCEMDCKPKGQTGNLKPFLKDLIPISFRSVEAQYDT